MKQRPYFTQPEMEEIWDRWESGESLHSIARSLERGSSAVHQNTILTAERLVSERSGEWRRRRVDSLVLTLNKMGAFIPARSRGRAAPLLSSTSPVANRVGE